MRARAGHPRRGTRGGGGSASGARRKRCRHRWWSSLLCWGKWSCAGGGWWRGGMDGEMRCCPSRDEGRGRGKTNAGRHKATNSLGGSAGQRGRAGLEPEGKERRRGQTIKRRAALSTGKGKKSRGGVGGDARVFQRDRRFLRERRNTRSRTNPQAFRHCGGCSATTKEDL